MCRELTTTEQATAREQFNTLFSKITRPGADRLLKYLETKTDYFTAPASTKYHSSVPGGLLYHSVMVTKILLREKHEYGTRGGKFAELAAVPDESLIIIGLFHDLYKVNFYSVQMRNRKNEAGQWEQVATYAVEDQLPLGQAEKSLIMLQNFMRLTANEMFGIRWAQGFADVEHTGTLAEAIRKYPVVMMIMEADMEAAYFMETEIGNN